MSSFAGGALTLWMCKMGEDHLGQVYFIFTAGFVKFWSATEAPRAKSESAAHFEGHFGHFPISSPYLLLAGKVFLFIYSPHL